ncbi:MAG: DUF4013 domain-containing protein [Myxococcota bacterium]
MDYLRGFKIFRDDPEWKNKLLVGTVLGAITVFIPVLGLVAAVVLYGWGTLLLRQAVRGQELPLPALGFDLDQWIKLLGVGLKPFLVALIWLIPVMLISGVLLACGYGVGFAAAMGGTNAGADAGPLVGLCIGFSWLVAVVLGLVLGVPAAVAGMRTALTDDFSYGLQLQPVLDFCKAHLRELLVGILLISLISGAISSLTCGIGGAVLAAPAAAAYALLMAQIYGQWVQAGGAPLPVAPHVLEAAGGAFGGPPAGGPPAGGAPGGGSLPSQGGGPYNQPPPGG